jgi:xanthine/uracil permease
VLKPSTFATRVAVVLPYFEPLSPRATYFGITVRQCVNITITIAAGPTNRKLIRGLQPFMSRYKRKADGRPVFEVGINDKIPWRSAIPMGLQNVFVMTGAFVFPGIMGRSFDLPLSSVAYLYGVTFISCGITSILISMCFGRMPLVTGPYAGIFTALIAFAHLPGSNLGTALGSLCGASLLWCLLSIPIRGMSPVSFVSRFVKSPLIAGVIVMLVMMQIADLSFPRWLGKPGDPAFPFLGFGSGLVTALVLISLVSVKRAAIRRMALLVSLAAGAILFEIFHPINFAAVVQAPWFVMPKFAPFGLGFNPAYCLIYFCILVAVNIQTMTLMDVVAGWGNEPMPPARLSKGVFALMVGSSIGSLLGAFTNLPYPANVAILRSTRVASRRVILITGAVLICMGFCTKIDYLFVLLPVPILSAAATVLFGIVFVHGVEMLAEVDWNERSLAIAGFSLMLGFGSLFVDPKTLAAMPLYVSLLLSQPIIVGLTAMSILSLIIPRGSHGKAHVAASHSQPASAEE